jgi:hypothetical protein
MNFLAAIVTRQPIRRPSSMLSQDTVQGDILSFDPVSNRLTAINPLGPVETQIQELKSSPQNETAGCATGSSRAGGLNLQLRCSI